jgi:anaerobic ribonucleoside-triphosphate reductase activating protein
MEIRLFGIANDSIVDGPGYRYTIFTQGCLHKCLGCHNPSSHDLNGGFLKTVDDILAEIDDNSLLDGVTFSGGEPMLQASVCYVLAKAVRKRGLNVIVYTGYTFEELLSFNQEDQLRLLSETDVLVDGKYFEKLRSLNLSFRGSSNQRLINVPLSLINNEVIELEVNEQGEFVKIS